MPDSFRLETRALSGDGHVVVVEGEVDLFTAPELKQAVIDAIDGGARRVIIDLSETVFLDSTALGVLISAVRRVRARDGELVIVNTDASIAKTFEITGLDQIFLIAADRRAARELLAERS